MERILARGLSAASLLQHYKVILLPAPIIVPDSLVTILDSYAELGGAVWIGFRSDLKDMSNAIRRSPSRLAKLAGVKIEEFESLNVPLQTELRSNLGQKNVNATVWREGLRITSNSSTKALWTYTDTFFGKLG